MPGDLRCRLQAVVIIEVVKLLLSPIWTLLSKTKAGNSPLDCYRCPAGKHGKGVYGSLAAVLTAVTLPEYRVFLVSPVAFDIQFYSPHF